MTQAEPFTGSTPPGLRVGPRVPGLRASSLRDLGLEALAERLPRAALLKLSRHDCIYRSGSRDPHIYLVERGQVKLQVVAASGKRCLLSVHTAGDLFGETALFDLVRVESAVALTRTVLRRLPAARTAEALAADGLSDALARHLGQRLRHQQKVVADMVTMAGELRLAVRLQDLAERFGRPGAAGTRVDLALTQEDLSEMVGTTRTRIGQFLKRFRELGLAELTPRSHLTVHESLLSRWIETAAH